MPTNGYYAPLVRFGETRTPLMKIEDARMKGTGYSIYTATASFLSNVSLLSQPKVTYDLVGSKDGKPVANDYFLWPPNNC